MPVALYIQLGMAGVQLLVNIITEIVQASQGGAAPKIGDSAGQFLSQLGSTGKIKELQGVDFTQIAPAVDSLFNQIHTLIHSQTPPSA